MIYILIKKFKKNLINLKLNFIIINKKFLFIKINY